MSAAALGARFRGWVACAAVLSACRGSAPLKPDVSGPAPGPSYPAQLGPVPPEPEIHVFEMGSMLGPFAAVDAICQRPVDWKPQYSRCGVDVPASTRFFDGKTVLEAPVAPFLEARLVARNDWDDSTAPGDGATVYRLGIRTQDGWFFLEELARTVEPAIASHHEWLVVESMRIVERAGEAPLFELRYAWNLSDDDRGVDETINGVARDVVVCGVPPSGRPRCTLPTPVGESGSVKRISTDAVVSGSAWQLELRYTAGGVELVLPAGASGAGVPPTLVGVHGLDFAAAAQP